MLLVDVNHRVLLHTTGLFYSDEQLKRLASALACDFRREDFSSYRKLADRYPGSVRRWERHIVVVSIILTFVLIFGIYGIALLFGAH